MPASRASASATWSSLVRRPGTGSDDAQDEEHGILDGVGAALAKAGYPTRADPDRIDYPMVLALLTLLVLLVTMVYGPIAAWLVELFPARIRYTSLSLPYHIGNGWFGGFLPTVSFALVAMTGDIYYGLWYPVIVATMTLVVEPSSCVRHAAPRRDPAATSASG